MGERPSVARVTTIEGTELMMREPTVVGDDIVYTRVEHFIVTPGEDTREIRTPGQRLPLWQVGELKTRGWVSARVILFPLALAGAGLFALLAGAMAAS